MSDEVTRRDFMRRVARWTCLGALGALVGRTAMQASGEAAGRRWLKICSRCRVLPSCGLPEGVRARRILAAAAQRQAAGSAGQLAGRVTRDENPDACPLREQGLV